MWYIFNASNVCVGCCDKQPDATDLQTRGETVVESDTVIDITSVVLTDGTVSESEETAEEKIAAIETEYSSQFDTLAIDYAAAIMDGDTDLATEIKTEKDALTIEYQTALEAINNV